MITTEDKLACVRRELVMRCNVYPRRVNSGQMTQAAADRQIQLMEAIVEDYEQKAKDERLL